MSLILHCASLPSTHASCLIQYCFIECTILCDRYCVNTRGTRRSTLPKPPSIHETPTDGKHNFLQSWCWIVSTAGTSTGVGGVGGVGGVRCCIIIVAVAVAVAVVDVASDPCNLDPKSLLLRVLSLPSAKLPQVQQASHYHRCCRCFLFVAAYDPSSVRRCESRHEREAAMQLQRIIRSPLCWYSKQTEPTIHSTAAMTTSQR